MLLKGKEFVEHSSGLFVSMDGEVFMNIKCRRFPNGNFTYGYTNHTGYKGVQYKSKHYLVHRLVAECFIPNPDNLPTVDHINRDKTLNNVENLRWASRSMQQYNRGKYNRPHAQNNNANSKKVLQLTMDNKLIKEWPSMMECGRNGFDNSTVGKCCRGELNQHKGYKWKYSE